MKKLDLSRVELHEYVGV